jgi:DNA-binding response OmpR family regulator
MKPTLLLAEGDAELCDVYRRFLTEHDYEVETAPDGLGCLEKLRRVMPAVLVLDRGLRWGGGDGVLAWLREQGVTSRVRVVLTATTGCPQDSAIFSEPPVVDHLLKPFALTTLLRSVRAAAAREVEIAEIVDDILLLVEGLRAGVQQGERSRDLNRSADCSELSLG